MRSKGLIGLLVVTAVAVILALLVSTGARGPQADPLVGAKVLPQLGQKLGEVAAVTLVHGDARTTLRRQGNGWVVEERGNYPVDAGKLRQTLLGLAELSLVEPKTRKADFYARLEVEDAGSKDGKSTLITASDEKGSILGEIIAGKRRIDQLGGNVDGVYVRKPGDAQSWLARGTLDVAGDAPSWLDHGIVDLPREKIKEVVLTGPDGGKLDIAHDAPEAPLALKDAPGDAKPKSDTALVEPTTVLASLTLADVRPASELPVPEKDVSRAEFTTFDGLVMKVALFDKDGKNWAHLEASGTGEAEKQAAALNAKLSPWVFAIQEYKAKSLRTKLADVTEAQKSS
jgi:Domain of unknown function (DUF4340)